MHNRSYNEQDAIQRLLLFEEGLSRLIELMKIEKKDVLGNDMDFLCQSIMQDVCRKCPKYRECYGSRQKETIGEIASILEQAYQCSGFSLLRSCEVMEVVSEGGGLPVAFDASIRFSHLGKRCVSSAVHEKNLAFAQTLTPKDILIVLSASGQSARLEEVSAAAKGRDVPVLLITCDSHGPLAQLADYVMTASNREQRLIEGSHAASLLSPNVLIEVLYYLLRMENL